jgi:hypothetical protein
MVRCRPLSALFVWCTRDHLYYPLLGGEFLVSTNLPLWGLEEEKWLLVIALPLWDPQQRRSILCECELRIKSLCLLCLVEFFVSY